MLLHSIQGYLAYTGYARCSTNVNNCANNLYLIKLIFTNLGGCCVVVNIVDEVVWVRSPLQYKMSTLELLTFRKPVTINIESCNGFVTFLSI